MSAPKVGVIAGGGALPVRLAEACRLTGRPYFIARIAGMADSVLNDHPGAEFGLGEMGARFKALKAAGVQAVALVGMVKRPDFAALKLDARAALMLPRVLAAAKQGDDAILRVIVDECEREGFTVIGAEAIAADLLAPKGVLAGAAPDAAAQTDIEKGMNVAAELGRFDIAQGCVVCDGFVLAVEAAEGTDAMLTRVAELPQAGRGTLATRRGVLVKRAKPIQDRRVDLPVIGIDTVAGAARAGLAGIAVEAGACLILDREAVMAAALGAGLFVVGV
jgi:UDP-2,3-diacylglucosamine hydrolase